MIRPWFDESDSMETIRNHVGGKHTPDSIREDARREYAERRRKEGATEQEISSELFDLES